LSEAPSHGVPCIIYDKTCLGSQSYISLAKEFIAQGSTRSRKAI
jgi:chromosome partitioning protein